MKKEQFKEFARNHKELIDAVVKKKTNWQELYELYSIYGEESNIWDKFKDVKNVSNKTSLDDLINMIKNIDLESFKNGINNLEKTIGLIKEIGLGNRNIEDIYENRPKYENFED